MDHPNPFHYPSLTDASRQIRLVTVCPGADERCIECELRTYSVQDPTEYHAVSYTWGSAENQIEISVNGEVLKVNRNCWHALWQIRHLGKAGPFFIDSICINQTDLAEKAIQVQGMSRVYQNARCVLACLGPHSDDSNFLMECLKMYWTPGPDGADQAGRKDVQHRTIKWLLSLEKGFDRFSLALRSFSRRFFFSRLWIYQEIFLASSVTLICGNEETNMQVLKDLVEIVSGLIVSYRPGEEHSYEEDPIRLLDLCTRHHIDLFGPRSEQVELPLARLPLLVDRLHRKEAVFAKHKLEDLELVLESVQRLSCQDPKDKIYGLLGCFEVGTGIVPDYTISPFDLALRVLQTWGASIQLADLLCVNLQLSTHADRPQETYTRSDNKSNRPTLLYSACQVLVAESGRLTAPFVQRPSGHGDPVTAKDTGDFKSPRTSLDFPATTILVGDRPVALVSTPLALSDWIVSLPYYTSSYYRFHRIGLILRKRKGDLYNVIGEAIFYPRCSPCSGRDDCRCQLSPHGHPDVRFHVTLCPQELLLLAVRLRKVYDKIRHETQFVDEYEPYLPDTPFPLSTSTTAKLDLGAHDTYRRRVIVP